MMVYGVDNVMKLEEYKIKYQRPLNNSGKYSCKEFINGIPVSVAQRNLANLYPDFEVNYKFHEYFIDLYKDNIFIEYDEKGHDMVVRMGKKSIIDFKKEEQNKNNRMLEVGRVLRIIDPKDKLKKPKNITEDIIQQINDFISSNKSYKEIQIS